MYRKSLLLSDPVPSLISGYKIVKSVNQQDCQTKLSQEVERNTDRAVEDVLSEITEDGGPDVCSCMKDQTAVYTSCPFNHPGHDQTSSSGIQKLQYISVIDSENHGGYDGSLPGGDPVPKAFINQPAEDQLFRERGCHTAPQKEGEERLSLADCIHGFLISGKKPEHLQHVQNVIQDKGYSHTHEENKNPLLHRKSLNPVSGEISPLLLISGKKPESDRNRQECACQVDRKQIVRKIFQSSPKIEDKQGKQIQRDLNSQKMDSHRIECPPNPHGKLLLLQRVGTKKSASSCTVERILTGCAFLSSSVVP